MPVRQRGDGTMSAKFVLIAAIVTLVTVIAAVVAVFNQPGLDVADVSGEPAFLAFAPPPTPSPASSSPTANAH